MYPDTCTEFISASVLNMVLMYQAHTLATPHIGTIIGRSHSPMHRNSACPFNVRVHQSEKSADLRKTSVASGDNT